MGSRILLTALVRALAVPAAAQEPEPEELWLSVLPQTCVSPCAVRARAVIAPHPDNRRLTLLADSLRYRRSSTVFLDGEYAARAHEMVFKLLSPGRYVVEVRLRRADGEMIVESYPVSVSGGDREP
jgi:hypothetical protein